MQWREANRRRERQTNQHHGLVPTPPPPPAIHTHTASRPEPWIELRPGPFMKVRPGSACLAPLRPTPQVTNPDGTRWISEEGFSTAVQSLLQFQAQLADKDPSAVQTQAEVIRELQEACHKHVLEAGVLRMSPHITMSLVVDLRMQCYSVRDPDLLKMGLGNLTGSLSALCQVCLPRCSA